MKYLIFAIINFISLPILAQIGIGVNDPQLLVSILDTDTGIHSTSAGELNFLTNNNCGLCLNESGVGINVNNPQAPLHIDAAGTEGLQLDNLPSSSAASFDFVMRDTSTGVVGRRSVPSSLGQFVRIGFPETEFRNNSNNGAWQDVLFKSDLGLAPNGANNFVSTLSGAVLDDTNPTTATIQLNEGAYSISLKLVGQFRTSASNNRIDARILVNGVEHTTVESVIYGSGGGNGNFGDQFVRKTGYLKDLLIVQPGNTATLSVQFRVWDTDVLIYESFVPSGSTGKSSRSLLTIQRLQ